MAIKEDRPSAAMGATAAAHAVRQPCRRLALCAGWGRARQKAEVRDALEAQPTIPLHSLTDELRNQSLFLLRRASSSSAGSWRGVSSSSTVHRWSLDARRRTTSSSSTSPFPPPRAHRPRGQSVLCVDLEARTACGVNAWTTIVCCSSRATRLSLGRWQLRFVTEEGGGSLEAGFRRRGKGKFYGMVAGGAVVLTVVIAFTLSGRSRTHRRPAPPAPPVRPRGQRRFRSRRTTEALRISWLPRVGAGWREVGRALVAASKGGGRDDPDSTEAAETAQAGRRREGQCRALSPR